MNRAIYHFLAILAFLNVPCQGQHVFNIAYDNGNNYDFGGDIVQTRDGGYVAFGSTAAIVTAHDSILILKVSPTGQIQWKFTLDVQPITSPDYGRSIIELEDGSLVGCGHTPNAAATDMDAFLVKVTSQGQFLWLRHYGTNGSYQQVEQLKQSADGGFVICGLTTQSGASAGWLIKTDSSGFIEWEKQYSPVSGIELYSLDLANDGGYILGGSGIVAGLSRQMLLIKTDSLGNQQWYQHYGGSGSDYGKGVIATLDGGYVIVGVLNQTQGYILKTNATGGQVWNYYTPSTNYNRYHKPIQLPDSSYVILGGSYSTSTRWDGRLTKLSKQGGLIWEKLYRYYPGTINEDLFGITPCSDGGFAMSGVIYTSSLPQKNDMWILKTDACGNTVGDTLNPIAAMSLSLGMGVAANTYSFASQSTGHCWQLWYFGDGDSSLTANPQHTYLQPGTYTVMLIAFAGAYSDTVTQQITILACGTVPGDTLLPTAALQVQPLATGTYGFTSQSTEYCNLLWDFGDGSSSTATNPQHQYQQSGTYTITHIAYKGMHSDTATYQLTVLYPCGMAPADTAQPVAAMQIAPLSPGSYSFTSQSANYCTLLWHFGDGDTSTLANPQHTYQQSGTYTVMHIATFGAKADTVTQQLTVLYPCGTAPADTTQPIAAMQLALVSGFTYDFTSQSSNYCTLLWHFGDGDTSTTANPQHTYQQSGTYTIMHIATAGAKADTVTQQVSVVSGLAGSLQNPVQLQAWPNPASGFLHIKWQGLTQTGTCRLVLRDMLGREVWRTEGAGISGEKSIGLAAVPEGLYTLSLQVGHQQVGVLKIAIVR